MWFRRDLRLADNAALTAAASSGGPVVPVFLCDAVLEGEGAAPRFRRGLSVEALSQALEQRGSRLILRRGKAEEILPALAEELGAKAVHAGRLHGPRDRANDAAVSDALTARGIAFTLHDGHTLHPPEAARTTTGGSYKVFTPFWKALRQRDPGALLPEPARLPAPEAWPASDDLQDWALGAAMRQGAAVVQPHCHAGEAAAQDRLEAFLGRLDDYTEARDRLADRATSGLSENLTYGEVSPRACWHAASRALHEGGASGRGAEAFRRELVWRDFAWHLMAHAPDMATTNWRSEWDGFPWADGGPQAEAWRRGRTGMDVVDAAQREMFVTGTMHNRARMISASYLTKHLMTDWRVGRAWFEDCLIDWDEASNAVNWQWVAGSGADASPFFRIFNPETQASKFDPEGRYRRAWIAEGQENPPKGALAYFDAIPRSWGMSATDAYPQVPLIGTREGRERALDAYRSRREEQGSEDG
ncbi:deoxyribodipyrimidine photo-lyase [Pseudoroseicyclus aestuarii]|uniref:Deoxyribodipyrimidine photo-lyase n=2 Tax=Pseudoroseicyclus aestuarii TaxID=1795041 RepID=A0A318T0C6_9RHOB|nr:deoxyribodipyrimidine photo-lyase [Pseudoroseicyclus aestuarii]